MSYQQALRHELLKLKELFGFSYKELSREIGVHNTILSEFGSGRGLLSDASKKLVEDWVKRQEGVENVDLV